MEILPVESSCFSQLIAKKQSDGERKFEILRRLSDEERESINARSRAECLRIASEFGKSKPFPFRGRA